MANTITNQTVCRALSGLAFKKTSESFAQVGADYRSAQTTPVQKFINWFAQLIDKGYARRTLVEQNYKEEILSANFLYVAKAILEAKTAADLTVNVPLKIDGERIEIISDPKNPSTLLIRHCWNDVELKGVDLRSLKVILLKQYLIMVRETEGESIKIDLSSFQLNELDLSSFNLKNCTLPDLQYCTLTDIGFNENTVFKQRRICKFDRTTFNRLQVYEYNKKHIVQEFWTMESAEITSRYNFTIPNLSSYTLEEIFSSDNPDLATEKREQLQYNKAAVSACFRQMRTKGLAINLANVNLSDLDLSNMNLEKINLRGADLYLTNLKNTNLNFADFQGASLTGTILFNATYVKTNILDARNVALQIRAAERIRAMKFLCGGDSQRSHIKIMSRNDGRMLITRTGPICT